MSKFLHATSFANARKVESWYQPVAYRGKHFSESKTLTSQNLNPKHFRESKNTSQSPKHLPESVNVSRHSLKHFQNQVVGVEDCFIESHVVASSLITRLSSTSMMKIVIFLSYSVFDEHHYVKKPWRNLETFESSSIATFRELIFKVL